MQRTPLETYKSVDSTNDFSNQVRCISNQADQERIQVQGVEDALNNLNQIAQTHNQLEVNIHISNGDVDLLYRNHYTSIDLNETSNFCIKVEICLQPR